MYHGNGVWQYNWQTKKPYAGKCVEVDAEPSELMTALFEFTK